ncbi:hemicentin-1-like [Ylistrum balloti]|uniref:hemicentin-1-like n=1 Tax=Ylistrum balloti TaxID=509963 RepID=UPI002905A1CF|nr:hemicentin-1-like [Ylistrum balloti]
MSELRMFRLARLCVALCLLQLTKAASYSCPCGITYRQTSYSCGFWGLSRCTRTVSETKICQCVDGGWSDYTAWVGTSQCNVPCGGGFNTVSRSRTCTNPSPANGGKDCSGSATESKTVSCNTQPCPVDGGWTEFGEWEAAACSAACGGGERSLSRSRTCTNPSPQYGGKACEGDDTESKKESCNSYPCPIDGGWTEFGDWKETACSVPCGGGERSLSRSRTCTNPSPQHGGKACEGDDTESKKETCNSYPCPIDGGWTEFGDWEETVCSVSCGGGERSLSRSRTCTNPSPQYGGEACEGVDMESKTETCNSDPCPIDGAWCEFNELAWTSCSEQCNQTGTQTRVCGCPAAQYGGAPCVGSNTNTDKKDCYEGTCLDKVCTDTDQPRSSLPRNCGEYVRCDTNPKPVVMPCPVGLHFDDEKGVCVQGNCGVTGEDEVVSLCTLDNNGAFLPDDKDCTAYYQCSNKVPIKRSCPTGTIWDQSKTACLHGDCSVVEVDEDEEVAPCVDKSTGTLLPDPNDCHKYIMCVNEVETPMSCGGLVFDKILLICNWESESNPCDTKP